LGSNEEKTRLPKVRVMAAWNVKCLSRVQKGRVPPLFYLFLSFFLLQYFELGLGLGPSLSIKHIIIIIIYIIIIIIIIIKNKTLSHVDKVMQLNSLFYMIAAV
jgi:hypothetical protein